MIRVGINASRARSGGAISHLVGLLGELDPAAHGFGSIDCWSYDRLLDHLPDRTWLNKRSTGRAQGSLARELSWERFSLGRQAREAGVDILFNVDAGSVCRFRPSVTMSQDMLSYEPGEIGRYGYGKARARLIALRHVQNAALQGADGAIFLTRYAADMIQHSCGILANVAIIPHGVDRRFSTLARGRPWPNAGQRAIRCLYVSNTAPYKHQWHVVDAMARLRASGWPVELQLVGGGNGAAHARLMAQLDRSDPGRSFVTLTDFVPNGEIPGLLAEADIFIFASSCENMPITLLEAMAAGLPIACSNRGPMPEVIQDGAIYFDPEAPRSIAAALTLLLENGDRRERCARRSKALADQFTWKRCADETFGFIKETFLRSQWGATAS